MKITATIGLFLVTIVAMAQCPTIESLSKSKKKEKGDVYVINSQSRTGALLSDEDYEMSFVAQSGLDYRLSVIPVEGAAGTVNYEVYELVVEKKQTGTNKFTRK